MTRCVGADSTSVRVPRMIGSQHAECGSPGAPRCRFQHEGTDLVDNPRSLRHQPLANAMQRLQVELIGCLGGDELHGWPLHSFGDCLSVVASSGGGIPPIRCSTTTGTSQSWA
jgi:hypothetical protein